MIVLIFVTQLLTVQEPTLLRCRIELAAGAESRHCEVTVPHGRKMRACDKTARQAGHCDKEEGKERYVVWVAGTGPGNCRITNKRTSWKRGVVSAKLSKSEGASSTCELFVEVR
jgi:hypothetical protein